jgi:hypothetical protein
MQYMEELSFFYRAIIDDCRIGATHISLYMALFQCWNLNCFESPVIFKSQKIMLMAKISSRTTYHKCMNDLVAYGYIKYTASYDPLVANQVYLNCYNVDTHIKPHLKSF